MKYLNNLRKIMYERYGPDDLYYFLFKLYIVLLLINIFIKSKTLNIIEILILLLIIYRFFSKKIYKRQKENNLYIKYKNKILKPYKNIKRNIKDRNIYLYKKCRKCKKTLKLPLPDNIGIKKVKCPNCGNRQKVVCLRKQKIEVIKRRRVKNDKNNKKLY